MFRHSFSAEGFAVITDVIPVLTPIGSRSVHSMTFRSVYSIRLSPIAAVSGWVQWKVQNTKGINRIRGIRGNSIDGFHHRTKGAVIRAGVRLATAASVPSSKSQ
jgi:hypothetical protein